MRDSYVSSFSTRYASKEMQYLFSDDKKFGTWRRLWLSLAKAEKNLGLNITDVQIEQMASNLDNIDYDVAAEREKQVRHDVMAHVFAFGEVCPDAKPIIHLGATSCYVGDNTDVVILRDALQLVRGKLISVMKLLSDFAMQNKSLPCLAYTHLQPAQLTTVGKRATLWLNDLLSDYEEIEHRLSTLAMLGNKGTTGTQASFMELFDGDSSKVKSLEQSIANDFGFDKVVPVSGQTYSRKVDYNVLSVLSGLAQSTSKFANDMRILQSFKEMEEPFEKNQIGSSAMPYKRNPMRCERITALARYVIADCTNPAFTAATQWFERTLDDSANKRIAVSEAFLAIDAILNIMLSVCDGLVVYPKVITQRVMNELPFMASENIMMSVVKKGGDRQELHEQIRTHSIAAGKMVKEEGLANDLIQRIANDPMFGMSIEDLNKHLNPSDFIGRADEQTEDFVNEYILPILDKNAIEIGKKVELTV